MVVAQLVLSRTVFGRYVVGIGTNEEAMRLAGVDPRPIRVIVFAAMGFLAALAGLMQSARLEAADPNAGAGMELQVIAAVVIGGTSLMGGRGSVINTFFGVLIIAVDKFTVDFIAKEEEVVLFGKHGNLVQFFSSVKFASWIIGITDHNRFGFWRDLFFEFFNRRKFPIVF